MAFNRQGLSRIGGGTSQGSVTTWTYASEDDSKATIGAKDYFIEAIRELKKGDLITVVDSTGGASNHVVSANDGKTISVTAVA